MHSKIHPRKRAGWEFFEAHVGKSDRLRGAPLEAMDPDHRRAAKLFIEAMKGCRRVLDVGCGGGFPGLEVAPHVGELVGIDAAPKVIAAAQANLARRGLTNVRFEVGGVDGLPYGDGEFDGAMLCRVLGSMDWEEVRRTMLEVWRVLAPGARLAVLDEDRKGAIEGRPVHEVLIHLEWGQLVLIVVERNRSSQTVRCTRYAVDPESASGKMLSAQLGDEARVPTTIDPDSLHPESVLDAWYEDEPQLDAESLAETVASADFRVVGVDCLPICRPGGLLFLTAVRA